MLMIALALTAAASTGLQPATMPAVVAGAQGCIGTTTDPQGLTRRLADWHAAPSRFARTDGQTFARDQVLVTVRTNPRHPKRGGCVVEARAEAGWQISDLIKALCDAFAARRQDTLGRVILHLPGDEILVVTGAKRDGDQYVVLTLAHVART